MMVPPTSLYPVLSLQVRRHSTSTSTSTSSSAHTLRRLHEVHDLHSVASTHSKILKSGLAAETVTGNYLLNAYVKYGAADSAQKLFNEMRRSRNVVTWTSLMAGFVSAGLADRALAFFSRMRSPVGGEDGEIVSLPNSFTMSAAINACAVLADVQTGRGIHAQVEVLGFQSDVVVSTALIDMYAKSNRVVDARRVFDRMMRRNVVTWGSMISAYAQNAKAHDALGLFGEFLRMKVVMPNHFMFSSAVNACASLGRLGAGKCVHAAAIRQYHEGNDVIAGALVDMYAKCGCVNQSRKVFERIAQPTVVPYTSMIVAAAKNGLGKLSLGIFQEMLGKGVRPNEVTLLGVLHACSHSGLVAEGLEYLHSMHNDYGITPSAKHYTCAVDLLGRAGRLDEAYNLSKDFPVVDNDALLLWTTLLSASRKNGRIDLAAEASKQLVEFNQDAAGAYVVMANTYESVGNWEDAVEIRNEMKRRGIHKDPGCSWVEIRDVAHVFYAGNASLYGRGNEIFELLKDLEFRMREKGYVGGRAGMVSHGLEEEESREIAIGMHSEKLALAFGLISTPKGVTVRVMKNLRICCDCHEAFKLISEIVERSFVVRDLTRFHHFRDGSCTCGDYW